MADFDPTHPPIEHFERLLRFGNEHLGPRPLFSLLHLLSRCPICLGYAEQSGQYAAIAAVGSAAVTSASRATKECAGQCSPECSSEHSPESSPECSRGCSEECSREHHFDSESLGELVWSLLENPDVTVAAYLRHLATVCTTCAPRMSKLFKSTPAVIDDAEQERIRRRFERMRLNWQSDNAQEREDAPERCEELLRHPASRRTLMVRNCERFQTWALSGLLCERSRSLAPQDASAAVEMATLAVLVADQIDPTAYSPQIAEDVRATARAFLGNALRVSGRLVLADEEFRLALQHLEAGTGTDLGRLQVLELLAHQRNAQRRREEALECLCEVQALREERGDTHWLGRTLLTRADLERELGRPDECLRQLDRAAELIDFEAEPRLAFLVDHQRLQAALDLEDYAAAGNALQAARESADEAGELDLLRLEWLGSRVQRGLGQPARAAATLRAVRDGFLTRGMATDAALAVLEIATIYLERGLVREVQRLAESIVQTFTAENLSDEALGALLIFCRAAQIEKATVETVHEVAQKLCQAPARA
ncbi:MAG: hypothetical protein AAGD01_12675 [Acidobacteriota bacterium]